MTNRVNDLIINYLLINCCAVSVVVAFGHRNDYHSGHVVSQTSGFDLALVTDTVVSVNNFTWNIIVCVHKINIW